MSAALAWVPAVGDVRDMRAVAHEMVVGCGF